MDINKLTQKAQEAVYDSQNLAIKYNHQTLEGEHLHLAMIIQNDGLIPRLLAKLNVPFDFYYKDLSDEIDKMPKMFGIANSSVYASRHFDEIFIKAEEEAKKFKDD